MNTLDLLRNAQTEIRSLQAAVERLLPKAQAFDMLSMSMLGRSGESRTSVAWDLRTAISELEAEEAAKAAKVKAPRKPRTPKTPPASTPVEPVSDEPAAVEETVSGADAPAEEATEPTPAPAARDRRRRARA